MKRIIASLTLFPLICFCLPFCNSNSDSTTNADTIATKTTTVTARPSDTSFLYDKKNGYVTIDEGKSFIKHFKDSDVDPFRGKAKFSTFDQAFLKDVFNSDPSEVRFYYGAFLNQSSYGNKRNWPVLVMRVKYDGTGTIKTITPFYFVAPDLCPPPEGSCASDGD